MPYPKPAHREGDKTRIHALMRAYPFAHLISAAGGRLRATRLPMLFDETRGAHGMLRSHMSRGNPQAKELDGADALIAFSGPHAYITPVWRVDRNRAPTWDYTAVHVNGRIQTIDDAEAVHRIFADLAEANEIRRVDLDRRKKWTFDMAPVEYVDRLTPGVQAFEIEITEIEAISKLHGDFGAEDGLSVASALSESADQNDLAIADLIRARVDRAGEDKSDKGT